MTGHKKVAGDDARSLRRRGAHGRTVVPGAEVTAAYERIWDAIVDHRLRPGTRLVEDRLCEVFGLGRTRIRQVLQRLAHEHVVTVMPNRGAVVAKPSVQEANNVFHARRVIEAGIVQQFMDTATSADKRRIREHTAREQRAWRGSDRRLTIKLSGEFHLLLGEIVGNTVMLSLLRELVSRSSLIIALYQARATAPCPPNEHEQLCTALEQGTPRAVRLMQQHLEQVRAELNLVEHAESDTDFQWLLRGGTGEDERAY
ncbi:MAG: transcriptional regulator, GntR family [Gammaproteobacteria bacterium]|nr:transcriptional regulator, GntR family [Gammaproteobacteria bacterium]